MNQRLTAIAALSVFLASCGLTATYASDILLPENETTVVTIQNQATAKCIDSDGADYFKQGSIDFAGLRFSFKNEDRCIGRAKLMEYTCQNNMWRAEYHECPNGCADGACIKDETATTGSETDENVTETSAVSSLPDGTLVKLPDDPKVYLIKDGERVWIRTAEQFKALDLKWQDIKVVSPEKMQAFKEKVQEKVTLMLNKQDRKVYRLENGKLIWVPSVAAFNAQGLKWDEVTEADIDLDDQYEESRFIKDEDGNIYFMTNSGKKILIVDQAALESCSAGSATTVTEVSDEVADSIEDVELIKEEDDSKIYEIENGQKRWIKTIEAFIRNGHNWDEVETVDEATAASYEEIQPIE